MHSVRDVLPVQVADPPVRVLVINTTTPVNSYIVLHFVQGA